MKRYILKRLLFAVPTILGSMMVVFLIIRSIPGDPVAMKFGKSATVQEIEEYREEYGYNRPMAVQMVDSIIDTFRGDLGYSMANNQPVFDMILDCLPNTLELTVFGVLLAIVLGVTSGIFAALYRGSIFDIMILSLNTLLMSMPSFFLGLVLIIVFGVQLKLIPVIGLNLAPEQHFAGLIGPVITVGLGSAPVPGHTNFWSFSAFSRLPSTLSFPVVNAKTGSNFPAASFNNVSAEQMKIASLS